MLRKKAIELEVATLQTEVLFKCSFLSSRYTKDIRVNGLRTVWQVPKIYFFKVKKWCILFGTRMEFQMSLQFKSGKKKYLKAKLKKLDFGPFGV